ncbi:hypothetical protein EDB92DRAFT_1940546 [Lactarius akahatsu]|uniref:Uncharacterized protein n=1 Tax=Lactarius akahatsu TaxID=416441 RepID=A0AAD4LU46_9AGAM|nr:hypothetical protein EDB92DRAFT_1940546 [Lactarius akahatsu]
MAIDGRVALHEGELSTNLLTPLSWMRLIMGLLGAAIRGTICSPAYLTKGTKSMNWHPDSYIISLALPHALTEGEAVVMMCHQLMGLFTTPRNNPCNKVGHPDSDFALLTTILDDTVECLTELDPPPQGEARELLIQEEWECIWVKAEIFAALNQEALFNIEEWWAVYKREFVEAMHTAFEAQYLGIHPKLGKGKAPEALPPTTHSQIVRDAKPCICKEVKWLVKEWMGNICQEIKTSLAQDDPFWMEGPLRDSMARKIREATAVKLKSEMTDELAELRTRKDTELEGLCLQLIHNHEQVAEEWRMKTNSKIASMKTHFQRKATQSLEDWKKGVQAEIKAWKVKYQNNGGASNYVLALLKVDGYELSSSPPSRATSPVPPLPSTPPPPTANMHREDPNVTPTPIQTKRVCTEEAPLPPLAIYPHAPNPTPIISTEPAPQAITAPLPPPPQWRRISSIHASIHAPVAQPTPISVHTHNAPPQAVAPLQLADPIPAPPAAAPINGLATVLAMLNATIMHLEQKIDDSLESQCHDPTIMPLIISDNQLPGKVSDSILQIDALSKSTDPRQKPRNAMTAKAKGVVAATPKPNTASSQGPSAMDKTLHCMARVDDPADETIPELITEGASTSKDNTHPATPAPTIIWEAFQPPADKHHYPKHSPPTNHRK